MSTICMTVHDLRMLLEAPDDHHTCHDDDRGETPIEDKTIDHWSAHRQLRPSQLDICHDDRNATAAMGSEGRVE